VLARCRFECYIFVTGHDRYASWFVITICWFSQLDISLLTDDELDEYHDGVDGAVPAYGAFLFGYPHLLPQLQGQDLARVMVEARDIMIDGGITALDLNRSARRHICSKWSASKC
jgi:hypothetical protein